MQIFLMSSILCCTVVHVVIAVVHGLDYNTCTSGEPWLAPTPCVMQGMQNEIKDNRDKIKELERKLTQQQAVFKQLILKFQGIKAPEPNRRENEIETNTKIEDERIRWEKIKFNVGSRCLAPEPTYSCPPEFIYYNGSCYRFVYSEKVQWCGAVQRCHEMKANLVQVDSLNEQQWLVRKLKKNRQEGIYWTALHNLQDRFLWKKTDGPSVPLGEFVHWGRKQPKDHRFSELCVVLYSKPWEAKWHDYKCKSTFGYICEIPL
ncbi:unnamed protein product [Owenia fusiformis]|uniref:C-type lectin domain-containing protein n=1 Tax=Owenia fusiformis TaxID=6347 RepID=A0A8S4N470_OWEFU|nr:unnamed protein product [Owenia fusiformis]